MADNTEKMFQLCIYNYMVETGRHEAAATFAIQTGLDLENTYIPPRFLSDWWTFFSDMYFSRNSTHPTSTQVTLPKNTIPKPGMPHKQTLSASSGSSSFAVSQPISRYPSYKQQILPFPGQQLNQEFSVGLGRPNPLNFVPPEMLINSINQPRGPSTSFTRGDGVESRSMSLNHLLSNRVNHRQKQLNSIAQFRQLLSQNDAAAEKQLASPSLQTNSSGSRLGGIAGQGVMDATRNIGESSRSGASNPDANNDPTNGERGVTEAHKKSGESSKEE